MEMSRLHELQESKLLFVSRTEFIPSKVSNFSAHASRVSDVTTPPIVDPTDILPRELSIDTGAAHIRKTPTGRPTIVMDLATSVIGIFAQWPATTKVICQRNDGSALNSISSPMKASMDQPVMMS